MSEEARALAPLPVRRRPTPFPWHWGPRLVLLLLLLPFGGVATSALQAQWRRALQLRAPDSVELEHVAAPGVRYVDRASAEVVTGWSGVRFWPNLVGERHCTADLWVSPPGRVDRTRISGCDEAYHPIALQAASEAVVAVDVPTHVTFPLPAIAEPGSWYGLLVAPALVLGSLSVLAMGAGFGLLRHRSAVPPGAALDVALDPGARPAQRRAAVALLGPPVPTGDPLLVAAAAVRSDHELAPTLLAQIRLHPTPARIRFLAEDARTAFAAWPDGAAEDATWLLAQGLQRLPPGPDTEAAMIGLLEADDDAIRGLAVTGLERIGTRAAVPRLRRESERGPLAQRSTRAIEAIAARLGAEPGAVAIAAGDEGRVSLPDPLGGSVSEAEPQRKTPM